MKRNGLIGLALSIASNTLQINRCSPSTRRFQRLTTRVSISTTALPYRLRQHTTFVRNALILHPSESKLGSIVSSCAAIRESATSNPSITPPPFAQSSNAGTHNDLVSVLKISASAQRSFVFEDPCMTVRSQYGHCYCSQFTQQFNCLRINTCSLCKLMRQSQPPMYQDSPKP